MATSYVDVLLQARDEYGELLNGGYIQTDAAGTTTPLVTYQDLAGATPNTNPVHLDSAGMATIRQTNGVAYKWRVYDSDMNPLFTRDNITVGTAASSSTVNYQVYAEYLGTPGAQACVKIHNFVDEVLFPIDFEGAIGSIQSNPAATYTISIQKNDVEIGTAVISTAGVLTFATTSHVAVTFDAGDKLTIIAPDSGSAADFAITLEGTLQ